jgi:hypothetical protein
MYIIRINKVFFIFFSKIWFLLLFFLLHSFLNHLQLNFYYFTKEVYKYIDLCYRAVKDNGLVLKYMHLKYRDKAICELAVKQNGMAVIYTYHLNKND